MRRLLAAILFAFPLFAQYQESVEVNVLELDVAVLDRDGKTVEGLGREDFEVRIGKRRAEVSNFYAVQRGAVLDVADRSTRKRTTLGAETLIPTNVVIFIDDTRLDVRAKQRAVDALEEYVATNVGPATTAMIVRWNGSLDVRTRPTERAGVLIAELAAMAKEPPIPPSSDRQLIYKVIDEAMLGITGNRWMHSVQNAWIQVIGYADRESRDVEKTLDALREAIRLASVFEGRKALLYVSEGLPLQPASDVFEYWERMTRVQGIEGNAHLMDNIAKDAYRSMDSQRYDRSRQYAELSRQAQAAKVNFYAVDAGGVRGFDHGAVQEKQRVADVSTMNYRANLQDGVRMIANETGGRFLSNENDLGGALAVMSEQFNTYYSLGVRASAKTGLEHVQVTVKSRPYVRVVTARHRRPLTRHEEIERAVRSRLYLRKNENPHTAQMDMGTAAKISGRCVLPINITVPRVTIVPVSGRPPSVDLHFALLDEQHQESDLRSTTIHATGSGDLSHLLSIGLKPGKYTLSLAIDDPSTGETSYLQRDLDASGCR